MKAGERREKIAEYLSAANEAVPAKTLSARFNVSRQVIVQDIAFLRAQGRQITATSRGYILNAERASRVFKCRHTDEEVVEECNIIVGLGGCVEDVFVNHRVYGRISSTSAFRTRRI